MQKLQRYCAYQDRCHSEVRSKLIDLGVYGDTLEEVMAELIIDKFLDEERFARSYARGKFRFKKWGRIRIRQELKFRKISAYCLKKAMAEIDEEEYRTTLQTMLTKKQADYRRKYDEYASRQKAALFAMNKGYESALVWELLNAEKSQ
ncbi:MAG: regulatory protein RecX [Bacteroidota bacterium]